MAFNQDDNVHAGSSVSTLQAHQEYPKMVYLHPSNKTHHHKTLVVNNKDEEKAAVKDGYKLNAHVPEPPPDEKFEGKDVSHEEIKQQVTDAKKPEPAKPAPEPEPVKATPPAGEKFPPKPAPPAQPAPPKV